MLSNKHVKWLFVELILAPGLSYEVSETLGDLIGERIKICYYLVNNNYSIWAGDFLDDY